MCYLEVAVRVFSQPNGVAYTRQNRRSILHYMCSHNMRFGRGLFNHKCGEFLGMVPGIHLCIIYSQWTDHLKAKKAECWRGYCYKDRNTYHWVCTGDRGQGFRNPRDVLSTHPHKSSHFYFCRYLNRDELFSHRAQPKRWNSSNME